MRSMTYAPTKFAMNTKKAHPEIYGHYSEEMVGFYSRITAQSHNERTYQVLGDSDR